MGSKLWRSRLIQVVLSLFLVAGLLLAACGPAATPTPTPTATPRPTATPAPGATPAPTPTPTPAPGPPLKIGYAASWLYGMAEDSDNALAAMQIAIDDATDGTGVILGRKVEFIKRETGAEPEGALRRARELVEDLKVDYLIAANLSSETAAVIGYTKEKKVLQLNWYSESPLLTYDLGHRYYFQFWPNLRMTAAGHVLELAKTPWKRFVLVGPDYTYGQSWAASMEAWINQIIPGGQVVDKILPPYGEADMRSYITRAMAAKPDVVVTSLFADDLVNWIKQAKPFGYYERVNAYDVNAAVLFSTPKALGADMPEGILSYTTYVFTDPTVEAFNNRFREATGRFPPDAVGFNGYLMGQFLMEAILKAGTTETEAVVDALTGSTVTFPYTGDTFLMDPVSNNLIPTIYFVRMTTDPRFPFKVPVTYDSMSPDELSRYALSEAEILALRAKAGG